MTGARVFGEGTDEGARRFPTLPSSATSKWESVCAARVYEARVYEARHGLRGAQWLPVDRRRPRVGVLQHPGGPSGVSGGADVHEVKKETKILFPPFLLHPTLLLFLVCVPYDDVLTPSLCPVHVLSLSLFRSFSLSLSHSCAIWILCALLLALPILCKRQNDVSTRPLTFPPPPPFSSTNE